MVNTNRWEEKKNFNVFALHCSKKLCVRSQNNIRVFSANECIYYQVTTILFERMQMFC